MTLAEAIAHLERRANIHRQLAEAPRTSAIAREAGEQHRLTGTAIALVLAALPERGKDLNDLARGGGA